MDSFFFCIDSAPDQNACNFQYELPSSVELEGSWGVALCEFSYINQHCNVRDRDNFIRVTLPLEKLPKESSASALPPFRTENMLLNPGSYDDVSAFCRAIQTSMREYDKDVVVRFAYDVGSAKVRYNIPTFWTVCISSGEMCRMLGFPCCAADEFVTLRGNGESPAQADIYLGFELSYLRCDFIESNTWINALRKPILGQVYPEVGLEQGKLIRRVSKHLFYVPVNRRFLRTLSFTLENHLGKVIDIARRSHLLLHFKKLNILPFMRNV